MTFLHCNNFIIHNNATAYETTTIKKCCSCLISSGIAVNDEMVAVEDFIDVGNILAKSWVALYKGKTVPAFGSLFWVRNNYYSETQAQHLWVRPCPPESISAPNYIRCKEGKTLLRKWLSLDTPIAMDFSRIKHDKKPSTIFTTLW